jgi:hypothetical protein
MQLITLPLAFVQEDLSFFQLKFHLLGGLLQLLLGRGQSLLVGLEEADLFGNKSE